MCQAFEAERADVVASETAEIRRKLEAHDSGEAPLNQDEMNRLAVQAFMLREI